MSSKYIWSDQDNVDFLKDMVNNFNEFEKIKLKLQSNKKINPCEINSLKKELLSYQRILHFYFSKWRIHCRRMQLLTSRNFSISSTKNVNVRPATLPAEENNVDAVISYGTDVAIRTQAYVCNKLGLIGPSLESANILTRKHKFRAFLQDHGIQKSFFLTLNNNKQNEIIDKIIC